MFLFMILASSVTPAMAAQEPEPNLTWVPRLPTQPYTGPDPTYPAYFSEWTNIGKCSVWGPFKIHLVAVLYPRENRKKLKITEIKIVRNLIVDGATTDRWTVRTYKGGVNMKWLKCEVKYEDCLPANEEDVDGVRQGLLEAHVNPIPGNACDRRVVFGPGAEKNIGGLKHYLWNDLVKSTAFNVTGSLTLPGGKTILRTCKTIYFGPLEERAEHLYICRDSGIEEQGNDGKKCGRDDQDNDAQLVDPVGTCGVWKYTLVENYEFVPSNGKHVDRRRLFSGNSPAAPGPDRARKARFRRKR